MHKIKEQYYNNKYYKTMLRIYYKIMDHRKINTKKEFFHNNYLYWQMTPT